MRLLALLACLLLAGCSSSPAPAKAEALVPVVTDPADLAASQDGSHVHDYWHGASRIDVVDAAPVRPIFGSGAGAASFAPEDGVVVPQGAAWMEVEVRGDDSPAGQDVPTYDHKELWLRAADESEARKVADVDFGDLVNVTLEYGDADLPHQMLSGWAFQVRWVLGSPTDTGTFAGTVGLRATAVRGLPLRPFPAHPDLWGGASEKALFSASGDFSQLRHGPGYSFSSPLSFQPDAGVLVPFDAARVVVTLDAKAQAGDVQLRFHGADTRAFTVLAPTATSGTVRTFEVPVDGDGDGPYGNQSLWRFALEAVEPGGAAGAFAGTYAVSAAVQRA